MCVCVCVFVHDVSVNLHFSELGHWISIVFASRKVEVSLAKAATQSSQKPRIVLLHSLSLLVHNTVTMMTLWADTGLLPSSFPLHLHVFSLMAHFESPSCTYVYQCIRTYMYQEQCCVALIISTTEYSEVYVPWHCIYTHNAPICTCGNELWTMCTCKCMSIHVLACIHIQCCW